MAMEVILQHPFLLQNLCKHFPLNFILQGFEMTEHCITSYVESANELFTATQPLQSILRSTLYGGRAFARVRGR